MIKYTFVPLGGVGDFHKRFHLCLDADAMAILVLIVG